MASCLSVDSSKSICLIYYYVHSRHAAGGLDIAFKDSCDTLT